MCSLLAALLMLLPQDLVRQRSALAKQALLSGNAGEAVARYHALVKELPGDPGIRLNLALALESAGKYAEEIQQLDLITKQKPEMFAPWLLLGMARHKLGQPAAAIEPLHRALSISPGDGMALLELADAYLAVKDLPEAAEWLKQLVARTPESVKGWKGLVLTYTAMAQQSFAQLERDAPDSAEWCLLAGRSEINDGHFSRAFVLVRQALKQQPDMRGIHKALAEVYEKTGHPDWMSAELAKEASSLGESQLRNFHEAEIHQKLAADAFSHLERLPQSPELLELTAESYQRQGRRAEALADWRRAAKLALGDRRILGKLAESLWISRSYEEAAKLLTNLVAENPNEGRWQYLLGDVLFRQQQSELALPHLEAAIRLQPGFLPAHAVLGRIYLQLGQAAKAIPHLRNGLPTDEAAISFQLGQAYRATGQPELAAKSFQRQQELLQSQPEPLAITAPE